MKVWSLGATKVCIYPKKTPPSQSVQSNLLKENVPYHFHMVSFIVKSVWGAPSLLMRVIDKSFDKFIHRHPTNV